MDNIKIPKNKSECIEDCMKKMSVDKPSELERLFTVGHTPFSKEEIRIRVVDKANILVDCGSNFGMTVEEFEQALDEIRWAASAAKYLAKKQARF